jgi:hypothetical protein
MHDVLTSSEQYGCVYWWNTPVNPTTSRLKAYGNVAMNFPGTPAMFYELGASGSTVDFGYNRYHLIGTPPVDGTGNNTIYSTGGLRIGDIVDNDPDFHPVPPNDLASLLRASPISIGSSGTNRILPCDSTNFLEYFHPAALATMNPLFFSSVQCHQHDYLPLYSAKVSP